MVFRSGFDPFQPFRDLENLGFLAPRIAPGRAFPALNVWEQGDDFYAEAELPGLKSEDLDITVVGNELTLKGQRKEEPEQGNVSHRRERGVGTFTRVVRLPVDIDASKVQATLHDGVLTLKLPKAESAKARKIQVNTQGQA